MKFVLPRITQFLSALILAVICVTQPALGQDASKPQGDPQEIGTIAGERLDPSLFGPGVIETMEDVAERERNMPAEALNPKLRNGRQGTWAIPKRLHTFVPHSGIYSVQNTWGDTNMGIAFPQVVDVNGAYFASQGGEGSWTSAIRVHGFRDGQPVASTDWFTTIAREPAWFEMNLAGVDRIEIEAKAVINGAGWYSMDDLTYTLQSAQDGEEPNRIVIDFEDTSRGKVLTGTNYAGLTWETGTGSFDQAIPGPLPSDEVKPEPAGPDAPQDGGAGVDGGGTDGVTTPTLSLSFQGPTSGGSFPPDTCAAAGPDHIVAVVNTTFQVRSKNGVLLSSQSLGAFLGGGSGDPRVLYDTHSSRWVIIDTDFSTRIYLAVSTTNNPLGSWFKTNFVAMAGSDAGCSIDFPTLGVDPNGIYLSMWAVGCSYSFFAIDKAPLIAPAPSLGTVTAFRGLLVSDTDPIPVHTYTAATGEYYLSGINGGTLFRLRRINPPLTAPTLTTLSSIPVAGHSIPPNAPAMGSTTALDTGDTRLMNAVLRDGFIWTTHTINISGRAACRWYKINPLTSAVVETGTVSHASLYYFYPSITVNSVGDAVMGFTGSNASQFAGAYYTGRAASDPAGTMAAPIQYKAGVAAYNLLDGSGRNRWGDYSLTTLDPTDNLTFWTIQEYTHGTNLWGTYHAKLVISAAPANDNCADATLKGDGAFAFTTLFASTDGPDEPAQCNFNGQTNITRDVWYKYLAQCTGTATVSLCGSGFNTKMAAYNGCPAGSGTTIACNDDFCGTSSQISFPVVQNTLYWIRVGGFNNATGNGSANISCVPTPPSCPEDLSGDNTVGTPDLLQLINAWGACPGCPEDLTGDGTVGTPDLLQLINAWGPC